MKRTATLKRISGQLPIFEYRDQLPIALGTALIAAVLSSYGYRGALLAGMTEPPFFVAYIVFAVMVFGILKFIGWRIRKLDRRFHWLGGWFMRLVHQTVWCLVLPVLFLFVVFLMVYRLMPASIVDSGFLDTDLILMVLIIVVVNLFYVLAFFVQLHFWQRRLKMAVQRRFVLHQQRFDAVMKELKEEHQRNVDLRQKLQHSEWLVEKYKADLASLEPLKHEEQLPLFDKESAYLVKTATINKHYKFGSIAFFYIMDRIVFFQPMDGSNPIPTNERALMDVSSNTGNYFRAVSRDFLLAQHAIAKCARLKDGRLRLELKTPIKKGIDIPRKRVKELENWILEVVEIAMEK